MSQIKPVKATSTYWVRATVSMPCGSFHAKVTFGQGRQPETGFVPTDVSGWNFSSREHAEEMAEYAAARVYPGLASTCFVSTEIVEEQ